MKRFIACLIVIFTTSAYSQSDNRVPFSERIIFGGGLGLQFGTLTFIDISPVIGYKLTPKLEAGIGLTYKYYRYKDFYYDQTSNQRFDLKSHMFGGSLYSRYHILENIFTHVEFERLRYNFDDIYNVGGQIIRNPTHVYINSLFVGGGLRQRISQNSYFFILALWNLTEQEYTPYNNPVLRMGVLLGR
jgi:hypothetical protein